MSRAALGEAPPAGFRRRMLHAAQGALYVSGAAALYRGVAKAVRAAVLMYHSVPAPADTRWIAPRNRMNPERFLRQMRWLARSGRVVPLSRLLDAARGGEPPPPRAIVLTFDDGYRDNATLVAPILKSLGLPAVLYLATGYVGRGENQWADRLYVAFTTRTRSRLSVDGRPVDLDDPAAAAEAWGRLSARLLAASFAERTDLLAEIETALAPAAAPRQTLTWDEVRALRRDHPEFELALHTSGHIDLSALDRQAALAEIDLSIREFETNLGARPTHFSFPYSREHPGLSAELAERGIATAMTGIGVADPAALDPYSIPRLEAPASGLRLRYLVSGAHPDLSRRVLGRA